MRAEFVTCANSRGLVSLIEYVLEYLRCLFRIVWESVCFLLVEGGFDGVSLVGNMRRLVGLDVLNLIKFQYKYLCIYVLC